MIKINNQLGRHFITISMLSIAFITIVANVSINLFFSNYIKGARSRDDLKVVQYVEQVYNNYNGLNAQALMSIIHYTFSESVAVRIRDGQNNIVWNSSTSNAIIDMGGEVISESSLAYKNYPMINQTKQIGSIDVGRPKSIISNLEDRQFISTINIIFAISFIFSVIIAILSSSRLSKKFLKPIYQIIDNTNLIKSGKYKRLKEVTTDTYELHALSVSIKELSDKLDHQEALRRRLTSDMAHELRTPLAILQSYIEAFIDRIWEPDTERLAMVYEEIERLTRMVKELSDLSIVESDEIKLNKSTIDLSSLIRSIAENYRAMLINKNITLYLEIQNDIELIGDLEHLKRVFVNILSNAYKYSNENGKIRVALEKIDSIIKVIVEDTGIGIPKEDIKYIFERFYRSDLSRNKGTGGTGIGLTITKSLVEANNGEINIESEEGKGTRVICKFMQDDNQ